MRSTPSIDLLMQKERAVKHNTPYSPSHYTSSNPILQTDVIPPPFKNSKKPVPSYLSTPDPKQLGLARGEYSNKARGTIGFSYGEDPDEFKPSRKYIPALSSEVTLANNRNLGQFRPITRDPILEGNTEEFSGIHRGHTVQSQASSIVSILRGEETAESCLDADRAIKIYQRNKSNIFSPDCQENSTKKKMFEKRPDEAGSVLTYNYALPYKEHKITQKPSDHRVQQQAYCEAQNNHEIAEGYKFRRNFSSFRN